MPKHRPVQAAAAVSDVSSRNYTYQLKKGESFEKYIKLENYIQNFCKYLIFQKQSDTKLSKTMSWLLRHGAKEAGFQLQTGNQDKKNVLGKRYTLVCTTIANLLSCSDLQHGRIFYLIIIIISQKIIFHIIGKIT